jgi:hypothetical protein
MSRIFSIRNRFATINRRAVRKASSRIRPTLMALENRRLLSTIVVNNPTDTPKTDQIDLRQAIALANTNGGNETIVFDSKVFSTPQTIKLTGGQLELSDTTVSDRLGHFATRTPHAGGRWCHDREHVIQAGQPSRTGNSWDENIPHIANPYFILLTDNVGSAYINFAVPRNDGRNPSGAIRISLRGVNSHGHPGAN